MSSVNRREYLTANVLDQAFLDRCQDNLDNGLHMVVVIDTPTGYIYASDRNKYINSTFYEALTQFPIISRTVGDWLSPEIEFSSLDLVLSNVDGRFNNFVPGGVDYDGWIGKTVTVSLGLRDVASTYSDIYKGVVTEIGGFKRDVQKITLRSRDDFDKANKTMPTTALTSTSFPDLEENFEGLVAPYILGDWTVNLNPNGASIPAFPVNGANAGVIAGTTALQLVISDNANSYFDSSHVYVKRGEQYFVFDSGDIAVNGDKNLVEITQGAGGGTTTVEDGDPYLYTNGDAFFVRVKGKDLGSYDDNIIWQAREILMDYGGLSSGDFDANWATYRDKATPAESATASIKARVWVGEPQETVKYVLQMLEQVRLEAFVSRDQKFKLNSMHFDDFIAPASISYSVKNWDLSKSSFSPVSDDINTWNRAKGDYNFDPNKNENLFSTDIYRNQAAITQAGKEISKLIVFPNLYVKSDVINQLSETLKLASAYPEYIEATLSSRAILRDIGDFVLVDVKIGSSIFSEVPAMIREIGYDPDGMKVPCKLLSLQMVPYTGYAPTYSGIVGGSTATITQET